MYSLGMGPSTHAIQSTLQIWYCMHSTGHSQRKRVARVDDDIGMVPYFMN